MNPSLQDQPDLSRRKLLSFGGAAVTALATLGSARVAGAAILRTTSTKHEPPATAARTFFSIYDFGAIGDGITDDAPAFQAAFDALQAAGGGTLILPRVRPAGGPSVYLWGAPIIEDFTATTGNCATFEILGQGSDVLVRPGGAGTVGLFLANADSITLRGINFWGVVDPAVASTGVVFCDDVIYASGCGLVIESCRFSGFSIPYAGGGALAGTNAVIYSNSSLTLRGCTFSSNSGSGRAQVKIEHWSQVAVVDCAFVDFYFRNGVQFAPGSGEGVTCHLYIGEPLAPFNNTDSIYGADMALIQGCRFDEGGWIGVCVGGGPTWVKGVRVEGCNINVNPANGSRGFEFYKVMHAVVERCFLREGGTDSVGIFGGYVNDLLIDGCVIEMGSSAKRLYADRSVALATIRNSDFDASTSQAAQTVIEQNGIRSLPQFSTGARPAAVGQATGSQIWNTDTNRVNVAGNGKWYDAMGGEV